MNQRIAQFIVLILAVGAVWWFLQTHKKPVDNSQDNPSGQNQDAGSSQTFTSDKLGFSFQYLPDQDGDGKADAEVKEMDNKVYVYYTAAADPTSGQWVERHDKDPNISLQDAIKKDFLSGYSDQDCFTVDFREFLSSNAVSLEIPANWDEAIIYYPLPTDPNQPYFSNADKCPEPYTFTNGLSYFLMDKNHPDRYYFFSIGQYAILADIPAQDANPKTWQDTFQVK